MSIATRQLVAAHLRLARHLVGIDVDQLDHPVAVGAAGRRDQIRDRRAADPQRLGQRLGDVGQHVRSIGDEALIASPATCARRRRRQSATGRGRYGTGLAGSDTYSS